MLSQEIADDLRQPFESVFGAPAEHWLIFMAAAEAKRAGPPSKSTIDQLAGG